MAIKSKLVAAALAAMVVVGGVSATTGVAQAGHFHGGHHGGFHKGFHGKFGWGFRSAGYGFGCRWKPKFNYFGDYIGSVRVCYW